MRDLYLPSLAAAACLLVSSAASAVVIDFENYVDANNNDYKNNFRDINVPQIGVPTQTNNGAANDFVGLTSSTAEIAAYDTTPADGSVKNTFTVGAGQKFTFRADVAFKSDKSSFGIYLIDPNNEAGATAYMALFNINNGSGATLDKELIRFSKDANPTLGSNAGTMTSGTYSSTSVLATNAALAPLTVTYELNGTDGLLTMSLDTYSDSYVIPNGRSTFELALRMAAVGSTGANTLTFDNVSASVPEPASLGLLALAALPLVRRRQASR